MANIKSVPSLYVSLQMSLPVKLNLHIIYQEGLPSYTVCHHKPGGGHINAVHTFLCKIVICESCDAGMGTQKME